MFLQIIMEFNCIYLKSVILTFLNIFIAIKNFTHYNKMHDQLINNFFSFILFFPLLRTSININKKIEGQIMDSYYFLFFFIFFFL